MNICHKFFIQSTRSICDNNSDSCTHNTISFPLQLVGFGPERKLPLCAHTWDKRDLRCAAELGQKSHPAQYESIHQFRA